MDLKLVILQIHRINLKKINTMIPNGTGETGYLHGEERTHCDGNIGCLHVEE